MIDNILFIIPIILIFFLFILALCSLFSNNPNFILRGTIISCICLICLFYISYLNNTVSINKLTVYQNGNIEITGKNSFGDSKTEKYSFSEYKVKQSDANTCYMDEESCEIKLTTEYYEQYKETVNTEKSVSIDIKN